MAQTTVALRVPEDTKDEWERVADESAEYDSLSHLIRLSVQKEITDHSEPQREREEVAVSSEVLGEIQTLQGGLERLEREMEALKREQEPQYELDRILLEVLPEQPEGVRDDVITEGGPEPGDIGMPPQEVADRIGGELDEVSGALGRLVKNLSVVRSVARSETDVPYYWVVEQ